MPRVRRTATPSTVWEPGRSPVDRDDLTIGACSCDRHQHRLTADDPPDPARAICSRRKSIVFVSMPWPTSSTHLFAQSMSFDVDSLRGRSDREQGSPFERCSRSTAWNPILAVERSGTENRREESVWLVRRIEAEREASTLGGSSPALRCADSRSLSASIQLSHWSS